MLNLKNAAILFGISMVPVIELRGAIPVAATMGVNPVIALIICIIGNMLPVPFIMLFGRRIISWLQTTRLLGETATKYEKRLAEKADKIMGYAIIGLITFVAIPAPGTGAWSGAVIATLLNMRLKIAVPAIFLGVVLAGLIMTFGSYIVAWAVGSF
ncbi:MAG: small multidrug export protein [Ruminococcaceae bacterium]|nr:small multidrug export protein [Oscillospiraceae bacterium]